MQRPLLNTLLSPGLYESKQPYSPRVTVLNENKRVHEYFHRTLGERFRLDLETEPRAFLEALPKRKKPDMVVLDWDNQKTSNEVLFDLRSSWSEIPVILTCFPDLQDYQLFSSLGVSNVILKPFDHRDVRSVFEHVLPSFDDETTSAPAIELDHGHSFIRASKEMRRIEAQAALVARSDIPILILGESGVGKEILALFTHKMSLRSNRTFMKINCAAMPAELLESELFGYEQGAFTGAVKMKPGKFEMCNDGTIFLDEIGEMPAGLQAKLLQILQDGTFCRLGGRVTLRSDVRIVAATNIDMQKAMLEKTFREDLYYRLNGISLKIPPLRERVEEIPHFASYFIKKGCKKYGLEPLPISSRLLTTLKNYSWPGNLREMENVMNRFLVLGDEASVIQELTANSSTNIFDLNPTTKPAPATSVGLKKMVRGIKGEAEKTAILSALNSVCWNRKAAAGLLQISYKALLYKIEEYRLTTTSDEIASPVRSRA